MHALLMLNAGIEGLQPAIEANRRCNIILVPWSHHFLVPHAKQGWGYSVLGTSDCLKVHGSPSRAGRTREYLEVQVNHNPRITATYRIR